MLARDRREMIFDIVLVVFIGLFLIYGLAKGFAKMLVSMLGFVLTVVLVYFLAKPFAGFLDSFIPFDKWINSPIEGWLTGLGTLGSVQVGSAEELAASLQVAGLPGFIVSLITPWIVPVLPDVPAGATLAQVAAPAITSIIIVIISAIVLFILLRIAVLVIEIVAKKITGHKGPGVINRILGMTLGLAKGYLYIAVGMGLIAVMMTFSFMSPVKVQLRESSFAKFLYENNFLAEMILGDIKLDEEPADETTDTASDTLAKENGKAEAEAVVPRERIFLGGIEYNLITT